MEYLIREALPTDMVEVLGLIQELAEFEKEPDAVEITEQDLIEDGFGAEKKFQCFVAESKDKVVGLAMVYPRYSTWKGTVIHLEDLIVTERMRGIGIGTALLDRVVRYGHGRGVKRISWEVIDWNEPAITFYEAKGAKVMRDWDVVQLDENGMHTYLQNIEQE